MVEKIIVYKLRHIPTGLFYQPTKGRWAHQKSNLGLRGKLYETKQYPKNLNQGGIYISDTLVKKYNLVNITKGYSKTNLIVSEEKDWEVVKYELKEI